MRRLRILAHLTLGGYEFLFRMRFGIHYYCMKEEGGGTEESLSDLTLQIRSILTSLLKPFSDLAMICGDFVVSTLQKNLESDSFLAKFNKQIPKHLPGSLET